MRSFDPRVVGTVECRAWETYYRREWAAFLSGSLAAHPARRMARAACGSLARFYYAYTYAAEPADVRRAAELRAEAMDVSDAWVEAGCNPEDPHLARERALLVRSYAALLAGVHR
jgi:hypothetical protein